MIGLLPAYVYTEPHRRERHLLLLGAGTSDYLDGIFASACKAEGVRAALELLHAECDWDAAYFTQLRAGSKLLELLERAPELRSGHAHSQSCARMRGVQIAELPTKLRQHVHYYENRARRLGSFEVRTAGVTDCLDSFEILRSLHAERWQQSGQPGVLADPRIVAWHRETLPLLAHAGTLRLCRLELDKKPAAAVYALIDPPGRRDRTLYVYLPGYSIRHAALRPGTLLLAHMIEEAAREGVHTVDFLRGDEAYKSVWHARQVATFGWSLRPAATLVRAA